MNKALVALVVIVTAATWATTTAILGFPTSWWSALRPFLSAITVAGIILGIYNYWAWRFIGIRAWVAKTPDLSGTWQFKLQSEWVDPKTSQRVPEINGYAQVDQTAGHFTLRMFTIESHSKTIAYAFAYDQSVYTLSIVYENKPNIRFRQNRSRFHLGAATFLVRSVYPDRIEGEYWTERETIGTLRLTERRRSAINSYSDGERLYHA